MDPSVYQNLEASLRSSAAVKQLASPPVFKNDANDAAALGQNALENFGSSIAGHASLKTVANLVKSKKVLKGAGISEEETQGLADAAAQGDTASFIRQSINMGTKRITNAIRGTVRPAPAAPAPPAPAPAPEPPTQEFSNEAFDPNTIEPAAIRQAGEAPSQIGEILPGQYQRIGTNTGDAPPPPAPAQAAAPAAPAAPEPPPPPPEVPPPTAGLGEGDEILTDAQRALKGLKAATGDSVAGDEDPFGLAITAALGIASVVGGLFIKTHHTENVVPEVKPPPRVGFGVQIGV